MLYVCSVSPNENNEDVITKITPQEAIDAVKVAAKQVGLKWTQTDWYALMDFMTVHYSWFENERGERTSFCKEIDTLQKEMSQHGQNLREARPTYSENVRDS